MPKARFTICARPIWRREPKTLATAGQRENFARPVARREFRRAQPTQKMHVAMHAIFLRQVLEPRAVIARSDERELHFRPAR